MSKNLVIVESPAEAKTINEYHGPDRTGMTIPEIENAVDKPANAVLVVKTSLQMYLCRRIF